MSTTIRDASLTTLRRKQFALYGWRNSVGLYETPMTTKKEQASSSFQGNGSSADVTLNVRVGAFVRAQTPGGCPCGPVTLAGFTKSSPATCGCNSNNP